MSGYISIAWSNSLVTFDPSQAAVIKYDAQRQANPDNMVNQWTNAYLQSDKGRVVDKENV